MSADNRKVMSLRIVIIEKHQLRRDAVRAILQQAHHQVVGEAASIAGLEKSCRNLSADIVLIGVPMADCEWVRRVRRLSAQAPQARILMLSQTGGHSDWMASLQAGASGFLCDDCSARQLLAAISVVAMDGHWTDPRTMATLRRQAAVRSSLLERSPGALTGEEEAVLRLMVKGTRSREIAQRLDLPLTAVLRHRRTLMQKLRCRSVGELVRLGIQRGWLAESAAVRPWNSPAAMALPYAGSAREGETVR